jgi:hypothetical protein
MSVCGVDSILRTMIPRNAMIGGKSKAFFHRGRFASRPRETL